MDSSSGMCTGAKCGWIVTLSNTFFILEYMTKVDYRNIEKDTKNNSLYRKVLYTVKDKMQLVLMTLLPGETIPMESHTKQVQFIRIESGKGEAIVRRKKYKLKDGISIIIPTRTKHKIVNTSKTEKLQMYIIYAPDEHPPNRRNKRQPN